MDTYHFQIFCKLQKNSKTKYCELLQYRKLHREQFNEQVNENEKDEINPTTQERITLLKMKTK